MLSIDSFYQVAYQGSSPTCHQHHRQQTCHRVLRLCVCVCVNTKSMLQVYTRVCVCELKIIYMCLCVCEVPVLQCIQLNGTSFTVVQ